MIAQGLDYSARRIPGRAILDAGYDFVIRYLWWPGQRVSFVDADERADLVAAGVDVHLVYEQNTNDPAGGWDAGVRMGRQAVQSAREIDAPPGTVIFFCADAWLAAHGIPVSTAMAFLDGARSVIAEYTIGAYGFADFVFAAAEGHADAFWLCGAEIPDEHRPPWLHLYQWNNGRAYVDGVECDLNKQYRSLSAGPGSGGGRGEGDHDVPITQDDADLIVNTLLARKIQMYQLAGDPGNPTILTALEFLDYRTQSTNAKVDDLLARPVADVDEEALAAQLEAHGIDGANPAEVKAAVIAALSGTRLVVDEGVQS